MLVHIHLFVLTHRTLVFAVHIAFHFGLIHVVIHVFVHHQLLHVHVVCVHTRSQKTQNCTYHYFFHDFSFIDFVDSKRMCQSIIHPIRRTARKILTQKSQNIFNLLIYIEK